MYVSTPLKTMFLIFFVNTIVLSSISNAIVEKLENIIFLLPCYHYFTINNSVENGNLTMVIHIFSCILLISVLLIFKNNLFNTYIVGD